MAIPREYKQSIVVPLPTDTEIRAVVGDSYDPVNALNVIKMMAGTEDMYPALVGMVNAIFGTQTIDDKHREMIILRAAAINDVPYEWQAYEKWPGTRDCHLRKSKLWRRMGQSKASTTSTSSSAERRTSYCALGL